MTDRITHIKDTLTVGSLIDTLRDNYPDDMPVGLIVGDGVTLAFRLQVVGIVNDEGLAIDVLSIGLQPDDAEPPILH